MLCSFKALCFKRTLYLAFIRHHDLPLETDTWTRFSLFFAPCQGQNTGRKRSHLKHGSSAVIWCEKEKTVHNWKLWRLQVFCESLLTFRSDLQGLNVSTAGDGYVFCDRHTYTYTAHVYTHINQCTVVLATGICGDHSTQKAFHCMFSTFTYSIH